MNYQAMQKKIGRVFGAIFIFTVLYLIFASVLLPADDWGGEKYCSVYSGTWERVLPDGSTEPIEVPGHCDADKGEVVVIQSIIPDTIDKETYLVFRSAKQNMEIYIGDELARSFSTEDTRLFGTSGSVVYVFVKVTPEDIGKKLLIRTQTNTIYTGYFYTVHQGTQMEVWSLFGKLYGPELLIAMLIIIFSFLTIAGSIVLHTIYHTELSLMYLAMGIFAAGGWIVANSVLRQLIFPNLSVVNDMAFLMMLLISIPFLLYLNRIQKYRYGVFYFISEIISLFCFFASVVLHMTGLMDYSMTNTYVDLVYVVMIIGMIVTLILDLIKKQILQYKFVALGLLGAFLSAIIQIVMYFQKTETLNGIILEIGLIILLAFAIANTVHEIMVSEREKQYAISASEAKGKFLAHMSHEIRTPINAVLGLDTMILRESREPAIRGYALDIQSAGQSLLALINDILDLTKVESGKMELVMAEYDLSSLIHDVMNMVEMKASSKGLAVHLEMDESLPSMLYGDDVRIRQILVNLLNNAVKYTDSGYAKLMISGEKQGDEVLLHFRVKDTGIGIKEEDIGKLFAEFERIEGKRNHNVEGTGLGMSITVQLLNLMGSQIQVESVYGEGSEFFFDLRQKIIKDEPVGNLRQRIENRHTDTDYRSSFVAPNAHILVVDDNAMNRKVFVNLVKETKVQVDEAEGGYACLEKARDKKYDLIFLDHMMPDLDGCETLQRMQQIEGFLNADTPVIALTANAISGAKEKYLELGFRRFLSKPIDPDKLEKLLRELLPQELVQIQENNQVEKLQKKSEQKHENEIESSECRLPEIEGVRWDYALTFLKDSELLKDTACDFARGAKDDIQELIQFYRLLPSESSLLHESDEHLEVLRQFRVKVHAMKTSAAMIGAIALSELARLLEYAARDEQLVSIQQLMPFFIKEWNLMEERMQVLVPETAETMPAESQKLLQYMELLEQAIDEMDIDTMDEISNQLRQFGYDAVLQNLIDALCRKIYAIEYEDCDAIIHDVRQYLAQKEI